MARRTLRRPVLAGLLVLVLLVPLVPVDAQIVPLFTRYEDDFQDGDLAEYEHIAGAASDWSMAHFGWPGGTHARVEHQSPGDSLIVLDPDEYCFSEDRTFDIEFKLDTGYVLKNAVFLFGPLSELWRLEVHKDREVNGYQKDEVRLIHPDGGTVRLKQQQNLFDASKHHDLRVRYDGSIDVFLDGTHVAGWNPVRDLRSGTFGFGVTGSSSPFHTGYPVATEFDNLFIDTEDLLGNRCLQEDLVGTEVVNLH